MKAHTKKIIAPVIITILMMIYFIMFIIASVIVEDTPFIIKIIGTIIPCLIIGVSIYVLIERIKEIRSGDEDDLSKY